MNPGNRQGSTPPYPAAHRGNTVTILGKRITLASKGADRPGRTVAYRGLPESSTRGGGPDVNAGVLRRYPPTRGNDYPNVAPSSRRIIDGPSSNRDGKAGGSLPSYPTPLDTGFAPQYIRRRTRAQDHGAVGPGTGTGVSGVLGFNAATDGGSLTIPHIRIPRTPITVTAFRRTIDMTSNIPARGIGAPIK